MLVLLSRAREHGRGVLDSVWVDRETAIPRLIRLGDLVEVFCRCDLATMRARYAARAPDRGAGHFDELRSDVELWPETAMCPLAGGWPVLEVDTSGPVDVPLLVDRLRATARPAGGDS